ncbi:DUF6175 family protein [Portibacter lacus]|uniref:Uncharacterized protein n=1 Tax=Portibacter lacus TaxID=1099794 RepID=A0AA37WFE8_9BACT|nr:DUF6175 family protein [Portibacter lacus]GLR18778.1 hypothetical protein GCM10007940_33940 [Portibacter lacus]
MKKYIFSIALSTLCILFATSKGVSQEEMANIQPTIMVIPFAKKNDNLRSAYERSEIVRIAITKVKEAFDERGVNTIDLRAKLKQLNNTEALTEDQASGLKDEVLSISGADIYVEVEASANKGSSGNSVNIIMTAFDAFSGESLSNKTANSPTMYTDNFEKLAEKAVESEIDNLLNTIQEKFNDIIKNGRTIVVNVGVSDEADYDLDADTPDGDLLSDYIEFAIEDLAYNNYYHVQGVTQNKIIFDIVKVPLKTEDGRAYRVSRFASSLRKKLKEIGYESDRVITGNNVVITLK